ncbi:hypothetical protein BT93_G0060 [Corymbia citriodora subsp. variegata]|nr:hypothetical protein BT93_G0060 [Corymbia citriodora subsp. variegata]
MSSLAKLMFICSLLLTSWAGGVWCRTHVVIQNGLPDKASIEAHCKSGNDDLGYHQITSDWEFSFRPNFWGTTLYFCSFQWPNSRHIYQFDIYVQKRDAKICEVCVWRITPNGPCRPDKNTGDFTDCYSWKP